MRANDTKLFAVRLPESQRRRIKSLAASQGLTLGKAVHQAFEAWASQLHHQAALSAGPRRDSAAGAGVGVKKPR